MQNVFADNSQLFDQWQQASRTAFESAKEARSISVKALDDLTAKQFALLEACVETGSKQAKLLGTGKPFEADWSEHAKLVTDYTDKFVSATQAAADVLQSTGLQLTELVQSRLGETPTGKPAAKKPAPKKSPGKAATAGADG